MKMALKSRAIVVLQHANLYINRRPRLRRVIVALVNRFPGMKTHLMRLVMGASASFAQRARPHDIPAELSQLTPRARRIYADLKSAIERQKGQR